MFQCFEPRFAEKWSEKWLPMQRRMCLRNTIKQMGICSYLFSCDSGRNFTWVAWDEVSEVLENYVMCMFLSEAKAAEAAPVIGSIMGITEAQHSGLKPAELPRLRLLWSIQIIHDYTVHCQMRVVISWIFLFAMFSVAFCALECSALEHAKTADSSDFP